VCRSAFLARDTNIVHRKDIMKLPPTGGQPDLQKVV
jgi:hypothetical protein